LTFPRRYAHSRRYTASSHSVPGSAFRHRREHCIRPEAPPARSPRATASSYVISLDARDVPDGCVFVLIYLRIARVCLCFTRERVATDSWGTPLSSNAEAALIS